MVGPGSSPRRFLTAAALPMARSRRAARNVERAKPRVLPGLSSQLGRKHSVAEPRRPSRKQPPDWARVSTGRNVEDCAAHQRLAGHDTANAPNRGHPGGGWRATAMRWPGPRSTLPPEAAYALLLARKLLARAGLAQEGPCGLRAALRLRAIGGISPDAELGDQLL